MGGQVLGGGVIVLVAVLLWLVYLLPSWYSRRQYDAAERNAVRLNQALRVLAETSETPEEVHLELNARTAAAQQKLAKRALAEREQAALEQARVELERAKAERVTAEAQARIELEVARAERAAAEARARAELAAARALPAARAARARRRLRFGATLVAVVGIGLTVWGAFEVVAAGVQVLMWTGVGLAVAAFLVLHRMSKVAARAAVRETEAAPRRAGATAAVVQDVPLETTSRVWAPRDLPRPLTASAGSRAAAVLDGEAAREALRQAAREEAMRSRVEAQRPPSIDAARVARAASGSASGADFSRMGYVDDAEIEAHVRQLLARRAVGQ